MVKQLLNSFQCSRYLSICTKLILIYISFEFWTDISTTVKPSFPVFLPTSLVVSSQSPWQTFPFFLSFQVLLVYSGWCPDPLFTFFIMLRAYRWLWMSSICCRKPCICTWHSNSLPVHLSLRSNFPDFSQPTFIAISSFITS